MMDDVMCIHCNSMHVRIKAKRPNSTSYKCKHCNEYFSTSHVVDTSSKHVIEEDQNTKKIKTDYKADAASVAPTATEVLNDFGLDPAIWTPKEFWLKETQKGNEADGLFSLYNISAKVIRKTAIHTDIPAIQPVKLSRSARKNNSLGVWGWPTIYPTYMQGIVVTSRQVSSSHFTIGAYFRSS
jgi:hypothetical protein